MRQYSGKEIAELIEVTGGDESDQAAAIAVVTQAIIESRRLGRIATRKPRTSWNRGEAQLRGNHVNGWVNQFRT
ncbi:MAG: hypothetical protein HN693_00100 [Micrococcales bacterium]|mgnify:FL=1|jgi:hypothetical protein|nr:hypothetical protein [Micrococcales bacterium]MBT5847572.1 hypothetical protein [Micrococcales bacterium]MBT7925408.1 hypothetical protein [Micrococcales bacterium]HBB39695.1 hypothetical protein [Aquiluna sp.]